MFHENIELLPAGEYYDLSPGNNNLNKHITLVLVGKRVSNKLGWFEVTNLD